MWVWYLICQQELIQGHIDQFVLVYENEDVALYAVKLP